MLEFLIIAIIFFYLGKYSSTQKETEIKQKIIEKLKPRAKVGAVKMKTPEERRKEGTIEGAVEEEMSKVFKEII